MILRAVLDASSAVEAVLPGPCAEAVVDLLDPCPLVSVPGLFASEVASTLWTYVRTGNLAADEAVVRWGKALGLADRVVSDGELAQEALVSAVAPNHPVHGLLYATLARRLGCTVITMDKRLETLLGELSIPCQRPVRPPGPNAYSVLKARRRTVGPRFGAGSISAPISPLKTRKPA
jgi:predicted nucleic acid-binding protein